MTTSSASKKGLLLVLAAALLLSIGGLCVKMIPWQPLSINAFRSIISVGILLVFAKATHNRCKLTPGVLIGALGVCGATTLYTVSTKLTTAGNAVLLQFTAPMFVILFMWLVFREKPNRLDVGACLLIFGGVLCFFLDSLGSGRFVGDVLAVAQVAGIQAAKHNWELIPMCHPLPLTGIDITFALSDSPCMVEIQAAVTCTGVTGVEMEALTAVSVAALTIYDMCKAVQKDMRIENIRLLSKSGGKSGDYQIKE